MIMRSTDVKQGLRHRQRGMLLNPFRFAASGASDPHFDKVSLLLHFEGAAGSKVFTDSSKYSHAVSTPGNVVISNNGPKMGAGCAAAGSQWLDRLEIPNHSSFDFQSGDFTLETWINLTSVGASGGAILARWQEGSATPSLNVSTDWIWLLDTSYRMSLYVKDAVNALVPASADSRIPLDGGWHHAALTRSGHAFRIFLNGILVASATSSIAIPFSAAQPLRTSSWADRGSRMVANLDEVRVTKGVARYTANFTPPAAPFPNS